MRETRFSRRQVAPILLLLFVCLGLAFWGHWIWLAAAPFVISLVFAFILHPVVVFLQRRVCRGRRLAAVLLLYGLVLLFVIPVVAILVGAVVGELVELYGNLPKYWENVRGMGETVSKLLPLPESFREWVRGVRDEWDAVLSNPEKLQQIWEERLAPVLTPERAAGLGKSIGKGLGSVVSGVATGAQFVIGTIVIWAGGLFSLATNAALVVIILFYLLLDYEKLGTAIPRFVPPAAREDFLRIWAEIDRQLSGFLRGQATVAICVGLISAVLYTVVGVDSGVLIGLFAGACNIIPYLGPIMGFLPAVLSSLIEQYSNGWWAITAQLLGVCVVFGVVQFLEGFVISPRVMSDAVDLHPMVILFVLLLGGSLGGVLGMLLAVPVACVVRVLVREFYLKPMG